MNQQANQVTYTSPFKHLPIAERLEAIRKAVLAQMNEGK